MHNLKITILFLGVFSFVFAQRGKEGDYEVTTQHKVVNTYTKLTGNASASSQLITVLDNQMVGADFITPLAMGDLLLIYQMQGVSVDINDFPVTEWGGSYTVQQSWFSNGENFSFIEFGAITDYKSVGKYEFVEVQSIEGVNSIRLTCSLQNNYQFEGRNKVQVVRVPRYKNLRLTNEASIFPQKWNGTTGGIVAIEVENDLTLEGNGRIAADSSGFRGGLPVGDNTGGPVGSITDINSRGYLGSPSFIEGSEKGESVYGNVETDYVAINSKYGYGSIANGGGGGGYHNAGGGGGSNVGVGDYFGYGVVDRGVGNAYDPAWNLEGAELVTQPSAGGGRGGYSHTGKRENPLLVGPHNILWESDYRRISGGVGGHPLLPDKNRVFIGGGGGAGHQNNNAGGKGGAGGGIVFANVYGTVSGEGYITANGEDGGNSEGPNPGFSNGKSGDDGAGGGGGGGSVVITNTQEIPNTIHLEAKGGKGGDQIIQYGAFNFNSQADGPGGGGAGGFISFTNGNPLRDISGGKAGTTNEEIMRNFPVNGATGGAKGVDSLRTDVIDILVENDTVCVGGDATLTATLLGNSNAPLNWYESYNATSSVATGNTLTVSDVQASTHYYIGNCDVPFRVLVEVVVSPILISNTPNIEPESCEGNNGSITNIIVSGGIETVSYEWNGTQSLSLDLLDTTAGDYTLTVTDALGCSNSETYTIGGGSGSVVDTQSVNVSKESCGGRDGVIEGLIVSGGVPPYTYYWNGNVSQSLDISNLTAGSYSLVVIDDNDCSTSAGPFVIASSSTLSIDDSQLLITNESCQGNDGSITGITVQGGEGQLSYSWSNGNHTDLDLLNIGNGSYVLTVEDELGCTAVSPPYIVEEIPILTLDTTNIVVQDVSCDLDGSSIVGIETVGGTPPYQYQWNGSIVQAPELFNVPAGTYSLVVIDANECRDSVGPFIIKSPVIPEVNINTPTNQVIYLHESVEIDASVSPFNTDVLWSPPFGLSCTNCLDPVITPEDSRWYYITATSEEGCVDKDSIYIKVNKDCNEALFPEVFSPNEDGLNDVFCVLGECVYAIHLKIYDRWGTQVFESTDKNDCWDGSFKGKPLNTGVFIYKFEGKKSDGTTIIESGNINLIR